MELESTINMSMGGSSGSGSGSGSGKTLAPSSSSTADNLFTQKQTKYNTKNRDLIASTGRQPYDYTKHLRHCPKPQKVTPNPWTIVDNIQMALMCGNSYLTTGETVKGESVVMGNAGFVRSGTCDNVLSDEECKGKPRYMFINNIPSENVPCSNPTQPVDPNDKTSFPKGLINGVVNDVVSMNPIEVMASANGTGSIVNNKCVLRTELTGYVAPNNVDTRQPETQCSSPINTLVCSTQGGQATGCVQLAPLLRMEKFNTIAMKILQSTVQLSKKMFGMKNKTYGLDGNYPSADRGKMITTFDSPTLTKWQNTIVTQTEQQLLQATRCYPHHCSSQHHSHHSKYANVLINSKGRCHMLNVRLQTFTSTTGPRFTSLLGCRRRNVVKTPAKRRATLPMVRIATGSWALHPNRSASSKTLPFRCRGTHFIRQIIPQKYSCRQQQYPQ